MQVPIIGAANGDTVWALLGHIAQYNGEGELTRGFPLPICTLFATAMGNDVEKEIIMFGFLIAIAAGAVTPMIETPVARPLARAMGDNVELADGELRTLAFMIAMIVAGVLCAVFDSGSALSLAVGGTLGYFGMRLVRWLQRVIEGKRA